MNFDFELNLKVSAFYLEKQKSFITAKVHPKDGVSRLNFPEGFDVQVLALLSETLFLKAE